MSDDIEPSPDEVARWTRNLLKPARCGHDNHTTADEAKMIAAVLGTQTAADHFMRRTAGSNASRAHVHAREGRYRPPQVQTRFEYYDVPGNDYTLGGWRIERFENGRKISSQSGSDYGERDALIIRYEAAGFGCKPISIGDRPPVAVQGRARDAGKKTSQRRAMLDKLKTFTSNDMGDLDY